MEKDEIEKGIAVSLPRLDDNYLRQDGTQGGAGRRGAQLHAYRSGRRWRGAERRCVGCEQLQGRP